MAESNRSGTVTSEYIDFNSRRVAKSSGKVYWYDSGGEVLAESDSSGTMTAEYVYFGGQRVAMPPSGSTTQYYVEDMLCSSRVMTNSSVMLDGTELTATIYHELRHVILGDFGRMAAAAKHSKTYIF